MYCGMWGLMSLKRFGGRLQIEQFERVRNSETTYFPSSSFIAGAVPAFLISSSSFNYTTEEKKLQTKEMQYEYFFGFEFYITVFLIYCHTKTFL